MDFSMLLPLLLTGVSTGLTCGLTCGACGNPMVNIFLSSYLFTHSRKLKQSVLSFLGFHVGKALSVMAMCLLFAALGNRAIDQQGNLFGWDLKKMVYAAMLLFCLYLIVRWFIDRTQKCPKNCKQDCRHQKVRTDSIWHMLIYGVISGLSPCASLVIVLGYTSTLGVLEAVLVGLCFSLANSLIPLLILVVLTGVLSREMFLEIPTKIKYLQLVTYILFAVTLLYNLLKG
ncbi:MAG: sulfite exporter TauE/SafE family protein [Clostridia bacterium]|nr:sulfite exporter TauE/SafE family protein [Clostridia bacterium]